MVPLLSAVVSRTVGNLAEFFSVRKDEYEMTQKAIRFIPPISHLAQSKASECTNPPDKCFDGVHNDETFRVQSSPKNSSYAVDDGFGRLIAPLCIAAYFYFSSHYSPNEPV